MISGTAGTDFQTTPVSLPNRKWGAIHLCAMMEPGQFIDLFINNIRVSNNNFRFRNETWTYYQYNTGAAGRISQCRNRHNSVSNTIAANMLTGSIGR